MPHQVMSIAEMKEAKFDLLGLDGACKKLIGEACKPTIFFLYGPGGSGKTSGLGCRLDAGKYSATIHSRAAGGN